MAKQKDWSRPIGDIIADIRQKLVEEGWFGKAVTGRRQSITFDSAGEQSPAEKLGWFRSDGRPQQSHASEHDREPVREPNGPDRGIDL
jgi:hypothetical protein